MVNATQKDQEITLSILQTIAVETDLTQRSLSKRLGLALGLTNNYLKTCIKKGLIKVEQIPANRYLYYLTPKGFAEKAALTAAYLNRAMYLFRQARSEVEQFFVYCAQHDYSHIALLGASDFAEIAQLVATSFDLRLQKVASVEKVSGPVDAWLIADARRAHRIYESLCLKSVDPKTIFCFSALKVRL